MHQLPLLINQSTHPAAVEGVSGNPGLGESVSLGCALSIAKTDGLALSPPSGDLVSAAGARKTAPVPLPVVPLSPRRSRLSRDVAVEQELSRDRGSGWEGVAATHAAVSGGTTSRVEGRRCATAEKKPLRRARPRALPIAGLAGSEGGTSSDSDI